MKSFLSISGVRLFRRLFSTSTAVLVPLIPATTLLVPSTVLSPLEMVEKEEILISSASS